MSRRIGSKAPNELFLNCLFEQVLVLVFQKQFRPVSRRVSGDLGSSIRRDTAGMKQGLECSRAPSGVTCAVWAELEASSLAEVTNNEYIACNEKASDEL